jgi:hypothetical protein
LGSKLLKKTDGDSIAIKYIVPLMIDTYVHEICVKGMHIVELGELKSNRKMQKQNKNKKTNK